MRLKFFWHTHDGRLLPRCASDVVNADGMSLLCAVLIDDGGLPAEFVRQAIRDGLEKIESVRTGTAEVAYWDREDFGVEIRAAQVGIYRQGEDGNDFSMSTESFRSALESWQDFLLMAPDHKVIREVEI